MSYDLTARYISYLAELPGFKIEGPNSDGTITIEASGIKYDGRYQTVAETIFTGYVFILARIEARRLVKGGGY